MEVRLGSSQGIRSHPQKPSAPGTKSVSRKPNKAKRSENQRAVRIPNEPYQREKSENARNTGLDIYHQRYSQLGGFKNKI